MENAEKHAQVAEGKSMKKGVQFLEKWGFLANLIKCLVSRNKHQPSFLLLFLILC